MGSRCATSNVIQSSMPWKLLNKGQHHKKKKKLNSRCDLVAEKPEKEGGKKWILLAAFSYNNEQGCLLTVQLGCFIERSLVSGVCADRCSIFICSTADWLSVKLGFGVIPVVMWIWCRKREAIGVKHSPTQCSVGFQLHLLSL